MIIILGSLLNLTGNPFTNIFIFHLTISYTAPNKNLDLFLYIEYNINIYITLYTKPSPPSIFPRLSITTHI